MKNDLAFPRYWLLDWFGHVVDNDGLRDQLHTPKPIPGRFPGIYFRAEDINHDQFEVRLRKLISLPMPIPLLTAQRIGDHTISLKRSDQETPAYMRSVENGDVDFFTPVIQDWEKFYLLSEDLLRAYAILGQQTYGHVTDAADEQQAPMRFVAAHRIMLGEKSFPLSENHASLEVIGRLVEGQSAEFSLREGDAEATYHFVRS